MGWPSPLSLDSDGARSIVICGILFPALSTLCVIGRFVARRRIDAYIGADDWFIVLALIAVYGQMVIITFSPFYAGIGRHISELSPDNLTALFILLTAVQFTFGSSLGLAKISLCLLLARIFSVRSFRIAAWCVMGYCACWTVMVISIGAGLCRPFAYNWDKTIPNGACGHLDAAYISIAALDILGDTMIIVLPMPWVWKLQTSRTTKIGLSFIFALGSLNIIVAILRIIYLLGTSFIAPQDFTINATGVYVWSIIEPSLAVMVASAPTLRPVLGLFFPRFRLSLHKWSKGYSRSHKISSNDPTEGQYPLRHFGGRPSSTISGSGDYANYASAIVSEQQNNDKFQDIFASNHEGYDQQTIHIEDEVSVHSRPAKHIQGRLDQINLDNQV